MSSFLETNRNQLNTSNFKQLYSFPKASRFNQSGFVSNAPYYDNKVTSLGRRAPSFGYGNKYSLEKKDPYPPPNHYSKDGSFDLDLKQKRGNAFTHTRKKGLINEEEMGVVPGPGKYSYKSDKHDFKRVSYSMRGKFADPIDANKNVPIQLGSPWDQDSTQPLARLMAEANTSSQSTTTQGAAR